MPDDSPDSGQTIASPPGGGGDDSAPSPGIGLERSATPGGSPPGVPNANTPQGVTPPAGGPMTPPTMPMPGAEAQGNMHMGLAIAHMFKAIQSYPPGENHLIASKHYSALIQHFKRQNPIQPTPANQMRPSLPQAPGGPGPNLPGVGGAPGPQGQALGQPQLPRGPVPMPTGGGGMPGA